MMEFMTFQHSNLLLLIVVPLFQRQGEPLVTLILSICVGDSSMIVGFSLDPLGGLGYAPRQDIPPPRRETAAIHSLEWATIPP